MYKKVNIEALCEAVSAQYYSFRHATARQFERIVEVYPRAGYLGTEELVGVGIRLTGTWDAVVVAEPVVHETDRYPRLIIGVHKLLPEFIVEGEEWTEEEPENPDGHE